MVGKLAYLFIQVSFLLLFTLDYSPITWFLKDLYSSFSGQIILRVHHL